MKNICKLPFFLLLFVRIGIIIIPFYSGGVRCMGDFWHMTWEETSDMGAFISAGKYLQHVHVASRKRRSMPGEDGEADNYVEGFRGLKMIGYENAPMDVQNKLVAAYQAARAEK